jgi:Kef-type K+ transport system membrane component KefB
VIGEVIAGILLGPSVLGRFAPEFSSYVFPAQILPFLGVLAQIGVILFMFLVGLELDIDLWRQRSRAAATISVASMTTPFALGALMNTRGLMELIVLSVGLDQGVISPRLFSMMVVMAVVTTMSGPPIVDLLARKSEAPAPRVFQLHN